MNVIIAKQLSDIKEYFMKNNKFIVPTDNTDYKFVTVRIKLKDELSLSKITNDVNNFYSKIITEQINDSLYQILIKTISSTNNFEYLKLENKTWDYNIEELVNIIDHNNFKYLMASGYLPICLLEDIRYISIDRGSFKPILSERGKLNNTTVYENPFMLYNDYRIYLFNDINFNMSCFII